MRHKILILIFLLPIACTQSFILYIKNPQKKRLFSINNILTESGLIKSTNKIHSQEKNNKIYPQGSLLTNKHIKLAQYIKTLSITNNSKITLSIETKNRLISSPYYTSSHIIYQADQSTPKKGKFVFLVGSKPGIIKIRSYTKEGILVEENLWYIEITPSILKENNRN